MSSAWPRATASHADYATRALRARLGRVLREAAGADDERAGPAAGGGSRGRCSRSASTAATRRWRRRCASTWCAAATRSSSSTASRPAACPRTTGSTIPSTAAAACSARAATSSTSPAGSWARLPIAVRAPRCPSRRRRWRWSSASRSRLTFAGGSVATIVYGSEADSAYPKELVEAHSAGRSAVLDDYRSLELRGSGRSPHDQRPRPGQGPPSPVRRPSAGGWTATRARGRTRSTPWP